MPETTLTEPGPGTLPPLVSGVQGPAVALPDPLPREAVR
jgi:hypothetical protein